MNRSRVATAGLDAGERRIAARHLLISPILTAARQPAELDLVRRHAAALKSMFASQLGYALIVESTFARLVKAPLPAVAPVRAARRTTDDSPFTTGTYVHLALACAALLAPGVGEQILISALVDQIRADAAEQSIMITDGISDRRQLVTALRLLVAWGVVSETDGSLTAWGERPEDEALLNINRPLLIHLLPSPLYQYRTAEDTWANRQPEQPRRRLRQRLVESPAVFRAELPIDELDVLSGNATSLPAISTRILAWYWKPGLRAYWPTTHPVRSPISSFPAAAAPSRRHCCCSTSLLRPSGRPGNPPSWWTACCCRAHLRHGRRSTRCWPGWLRGTEPPGRVPTANRWPPCAPMSSVFLPH
jgi:hypothetical protein